MRSSALATLFASLGSAGAIQAGARGNSSSTSAVCNLFEDTAGFTGWQYLASPVTSTTLAGDFTLSIKIETGNPPCAGGWRGIMGGGCGSMGLWFNGGLRNERQCGPHPGTSIIGCSSFSASTQYWITIVRSGSSGTMSIYTVGADGGYGPLVDSSTYTMESSYSDGIKTIGCASNGGGEAFDGKIFCMGTSMPPAAGAASGGAGAAAVGDPHLQNVHGERFDLMKPGQHVLINIPRGASADKALLRVQADARKLGGQCADMYFQELNVTGSWAEANQAGGYHYSVSQGDFRAPEWVAFGKVGIKVVRGRTDSGLSYLNFYVKHLGRAGFPVGGLLGEDDHEDVITPAANCAKSMSLLEMGEGGRRATSMLSFATASLA